MSTPENQNQAPEAPHVLLEQEQDGYRLRIELLEKEMVCSLSLWPTAKGTAPGADELGELLAQQGVCVELNSEALQELCRKTARGKSAENIPVALGVPSEPGEDGRLEFLVQISSEDASYNEDESGRIDYRNSNLFSNIFPDQEIVRIHPPRLGPPGKTVIGTPLDPVPGQGVTPKLGKGVELCDNGQYVLAQAAGRAVFEKGTISVTEDFVIDGDLNLRIGNIDFNGFVHVKRDVLDDFNISAHKGIRVEGAVGACRLDSGGDIELGSMSGNENGFITCKGSLKATFLNGVHVECYGDVVVQNEIRNSVIKAGGSIRIEKGTIFGGECIALEGIEARTIGSHIGVNTRLKVGVYFPEEDLLQDIRNQLRRATSQIKSIADTLGPLSRKRIEDITLTATNKRIEVLTRQIELSNRQKLGLEKELETFQHEDHDAANPKINIHNQISPGVYISFGSAFHTNDTQMSGPISIIENSKDESLRYLPMTALTVKADEIEKELVEKEVASENPPNSSPSP